MVLVTAMVLLLASSGPQAPVSPDPDEEPCPPERVGVADHHVVERFVSDLRKALTSDATAVVGLIRFPLVVNSRDRAFAKVRTRTFQGVGELTRYAAEVFSKGLRERVLSSSARDLICRPGQVGLADGLIWARPDTLGRLHVEVVNNDEFQWPAMASAELLRCETSRRLVVIDRPRTEVRFRAWPRSRNGIGEPAEVREGATESWEGTGSCVHAIWSFGTPGDRLVVMPAGCGGGEPQPLGYLNGVPCFATHD